MQRKQHFCLPSGHKKLFCLPRKEKPPLTAVSQTRRNCSGNIYCLSGQHLLPSRSERQWMSADLAVDVGRQPKGHRNDEPTIIRK